MEINKEQQASLLIQPALIRLIDQIRKQLETSDWRGSYQTLESWPEGTTPETKATVVNLQAQLDTAPPEQMAQLNQALSHLPQPELTYLLQLTKQDHRVDVDLWELCYQICFGNYDPARRQGLEEIQVDTSLIEPAGEVDWHRLDDKAQQVVARVFDQLPAAEVGT